MVIDRVSLEYDTQLAPVLLRFARELTIAPLPFGNRVRIRDVQKRQTALTSLLRLAIVRGLIVKSTGSGGHVPVVVLEIDRET